MNWKIFTATLALTQFFLIWIAAISIQVWETYSGLLDGGTDSWEVSFAIALPATLTGLALVLVNLSESRQRVRLIGLALSSGLFLHYFLISSWLLWVEYEFPPRIPLWGLISGDNPVIYEGELRWFALVSELSVVFLILTALGMFFLFRKEKAFASLQNSAAVACQSCGDSQEVANRFCTKCGAQISS